MNNLNNNVQVGIDQYHPADVPQESWNNERSSESDFSDRLGDIAQAQHTYLDAHPPCTSVSPHPARYPTPGPDLGGSPKRTNQYSENKPEPVPSPVSQEKLPLLVFQCPRIMEEVEDLSSLSPTLVLPNESLGNSETSDVTVKPCQNSTTSAPTKGEPVPFVRPSPQSKI